MRVQRPAAEPLLIAGFTARADVVWRAVHLQSRPARVLLRGITVEVRQQCAAGTDSNKAPAQFASPPDCGRVVISLD
jgi:hypothetical protein